MGRKLALRLDPEASSQEHYQKGWKTNIRFFVCRCGWGIGGCGPLGTFTLPFDREVRVVPWEVTNEMRGRDQGHPCFSEQHVGVLFSFREGVHLLEATDIATGETARTRIEVRPW